MDVETPFLIQVVNINGSTSDALRAPRKTERFANVIRNEDRCYVFIRLLEQMRPRKQKPLVLLPRRPKTKKVRQILIEALLNRIRQRATNTAEKRGSLSPLRPVGSSSSSSASNQTADETSSHPDTHSSRSFGLIRGQTVMPLHLLINTGQLFWRFEIVSLIAVSTPAVLTPFGSSGKKEPTWADELRGTKGGQLDSNQINGRI